MPEDSHFVAASGPQTTNPEVSVVIPTYNRSGRLQRVLEALALQSFDAARFEVVVVSDGSDDGTDQLVPGLETPYALAFSTQANQGPAAARNRAVAMASGRLILFLDDDVIPGPGLVEEHLRAHGADDGLVVVGPMLNPADHHLNPFVSWEQAMLYKQYDAMRRGDFVATYRQFYTGNASVERQRVLDAGGFDEGYRRAEDVELAYRLEERGARFVFDDRARAFHYAERSFGSWMRNAWEYGRNDVIFDRQHPGTGRLAAARREFRARKRLTRALCWFCVAHPWSIQVLRGIVRATATIGDRLGMKKATKMALSGLYNSVYYSGMAEQLGGPQAFRRLMKDRDLPCR